ncbi:rod shape-determining protein MreC [Deferribacter thermophilus]|uniref:rod shape-determining protein MreC n=1 Tax=Deferribacter thermophilus TaxID=53573 RepID=UPI003C1DFF59
MLKLKKNLFFIVLLLLLLIFLQFKIPSTYRPIRGLLGTFLNPFLYIVDSTTDYFLKVIDNYIFLINVKKENTELLKKLELLEFENILLKEKIKELDRLRKLLNFKETYKLNTIAANVIGKNIYGLEKYIIIDMGSTNGIKVNFPVISSKGLVGKVIEVYKNSAKVKLTLDRTLKVSVLNLNSRETGVVRGFEKGDLIVDYFSDLGEVKVGDIFITSGLGMLYPKGIPVGVVTKIEDPKYGLFKKVFLKPTVDFNRIENVLVIVKNEKN